MELVRQGLYSVYWKGEGWRSAYLLSVCINRTCCRVRCGSRVEGGWQYLGRALSGCGLRDVSGSDSVWTCTGLQSRDEAGGDGQKIGWELKRTMSSLRARRDSWQAMLPLPWFPPGWSTLRTEDSCRQKNGPKQRLETSTLFLPKPICFFLFCIWAQCSRVLSEREQS